MSDDDLVEDPQGAARNPYADMAQEDLAEAARRAQERTREQWAKEDAERPSPPVPEVETVEAIKARLAHEREEDARRATREQALAEERKRLEAERRQQERRERIEAWDHKIEQMYPRFRKATLVTLNPAVADDIRQWLHDDSAGALILFGPTGSGKTHAAFAVMREVFIGGRRTRFWPVPNYLDVLRPGKEGDKHFEDARTVDLLVLDDFGVEKRSDWVQERLYITVNDRWLQEKRTVVTSNLEPPALKEVVGERMYSRLRDGAKLVWLGGSDRRMKK